MRRDEGKAKRTRVGEKRKQVASGWHGSFYSGCTIESPGKQNDPKAQVHPDQPLRTVIGKTERRRYLYSGLRGGWWFEKGLPHWEGAQGHCVGGSAWLVPTAAPCLPHRQRAVILADGVGEPVQGEGQGGGTAPNFVLGLNLSFTSRSLQLLSPASRNGQALKPPAAEARLSKPPFPPLRKGTGTSFLGEVRAEEAGSRGCGLTLWRLHGTMLLLPLKVA